MPRRTAVAYTLALGLFLGGSALILKAGAGLAGSGAPAQRTLAAGPGAAIPHPLPLLLLQILVVTSLARAAGAAARGLGQPAVVGEIAAGLALGPSLLGLAFPAAQERLFPAASLQPLQLISQIGILVFMFLMGLELDLADLRRRAHAAVAVSHASIMLPCLLGMAASLALYGRFAPEGVSFSAFALFMGTAMSVTAFPVLARILEERGLSKTPLGSTALTCAAVDDATAWCLLAAVSAIAGAGSPLGALTTLLLGAGFTGAMLGVVRPLLAERLGSARGTKDEVFAMTVLALASGLCADAIGIHAVFGAFVAGLAAPPSPALRASLRGGLETFASTLLVPLFFAFTGLRTRLPLLADPAAWAAFLLVLAAAVIGKWGGSCAAARLTGLGWRESLGLGALMNTRGLMELVVLNVGYDLGIIPEPLFAAMVLMALATTVMTGPALTLLGLSPRPARAPVESRASIG